MGSKGQHHGEWRPSKVFNQVGQRKKDLASLVILEVEPSGGIKTPTEEEAACKVSRGVGGKAIGKDEAQKTLDL